MKHLEYYLDKECTKTIQGDTFDFGEWDIALGAEFIVYVKNPNSYAKAILHDVKHSDPRTIIDLPDEINKGEVKLIKVKLLPVDFENEENEREYFADLFDQITGGVKWVTV